MCHLRLIFLLLLMVSIMPHLLEGKRHRSKKFPIRYGPAPAPKCFVGHETGYKMEHCDGDGCRTFDCGIMKEVKDCGKCPDNSKDHPNGLENCKCRDCVGRLCNKEFGICKSFQLNGDILDMAPCEEFERKKEEGKI